VFGCSKGISLGGICDNNSTPGRSIHIDIIDPGPCPPDKPELFSCFDHFCRDLSTAADEKRIIVPDNVDKLLFREIRFDLYLELRSEQLQTIFGQRIADQYPEAHMKTHSISLPELF